MTTLARNVNNLQRLNRVQTSPVADELIEKVRAAFVDFINSNEKYSNSIRNLLNSDQNTVQINFASVLKFSSSLATAIQAEYFRVYPCLVECVRSLLTSFFEAESTAINSREVSKKQLYVSFTDLNYQLKIRELVTEKMGMLVKISAQVVRTHPVHPELVVGAFVCADCQTVCRDVSQQFKYTQPNICANPACSNRTNFTLDIEQSVFADFQKLRVQEVQSELPRGCLPRSLEIIVRGDTVETVQAGDQCEIIGCLIVVPDLAAISLPGAKSEAAPPTSSNANNGLNSGSGVTGLKSLGVRDLTYRLAFICSSIKSNTKSENLNENEHESENSSKLLLKMRNDPNLFNNLTNSIFPSIYGNNFIKKGVLLMLFGGVAKTTTELTTLRGDINVCIVGDPSTAKSQILKQVELLSDRVVYTSGKASSAAGLTAAVIRDEETREFVIEAGALMLADTGICCIDEFDKMDRHDQVAIHEAMEQQTISIAKAGVNATLNARASILAAANPVGSRYDKSRSLRANIALPPPIVSRFDLIFVLVDECDEAMDFSIASHIVQLHKKSDNSLLTTKYSLDEIKRYIKFCREIKPMLSESANNMLVQLYKSLRMREASSKSSWKPTVRQLESMIRLSEAVARLHCCEVVSAEHVREAWSLLSRSIVRIDNPDVILEVAANEDAVDVTKKISHREYCKVCNMLTGYLKERELAAVDEFVGVKKSELLNWYLDEIEGEIHSQEELQRKIDIFEKIVVKLSEEQNVLIAIQNDEDEQDCFFTVHPNYI